MQPTQKTTNFSQKSFYMGIGSVTILVLEIFVLLFGISDGSLIFVVPLLASPVFGVLGVIFGVVALRRNEPSRHTTIVGISSSALCLMIFAGLTAAVIAITSAL